MNKDAKLKYKDDFVTLTELLNSFDLCGLIESGAPKDEYHCLTEKLLSSVYKGMTREEMQELIVHEMEHHFGSSDENTGFTFSWVNDWNFIEVPFHFGQMLNKQTSFFAGPKLDLAADNFDKRKESTSKFLGISAEIGGQYNFSSHLFAESEYSIGISKSFNDLFFDINNGRRDNFRIGEGIVFNVIYAFFPVG